MRWSLRLSEFDFVVEHKAGTKIKHADALSRHVGAIMEDSLPDKERFREEQRRDFFCLLYLGRNRVRVVDCSVLRKIFWPKVEDVTGHWEKAT